MMQEHDSPGDYDIHNSGAGMMLVSAIELTRSEQIECLSSLGDFLVNATEARIRPKLLNLSLDYDEVWCHPKRIPTS